MALLVRVVQGHTGEVMFWDSMIKLFKDGFRTIDLVEQNTEKSKILSISDFGDGVIKKA